MKKLLFLFVLLFAFASYAQVSEVVYDATIANSASATIYIVKPSNGNQELDSVDLRVVYTGEIDIDQLVVTKGILKSNVGGIANNFLAVATPDTTTLTVDNAAATTTGAVYTASSTGLNSVDGYDVFKIVFTAGSAGNDATDPNKIRVTAEKHFTATRY